MNLEIKNIGVGNAIIPVNITVFDQQDSMIGLYAPEAVITDAISGGADNALQNMQFVGGMDQSLGLQAAGAVSRPLRGYSVKRYSASKSSWIMAGRSYCATILKSITINIFNMNRTNLENLWTELKGLKFDDKYIKQMEEMMAKGLPSFELKGLFPMDKG
ncbi:conjugative transposon protein TraM [Mucilaginibacter sp. 10B2]|uniref:conjugative transposon protein TraM n=1 Tax=Mucilaginibacter sp. 10B2 TaxID=3048574 RepID=UPI002B226FAF|nr:conjugative transposon protein TraM [Mucilaginibacter sp. 10B2]MEB0278808.1 conjugative transposon protein TraM [Mucilaginibacter sp. 10B2]